jgi:DNA translocase FtsK/SpoIIIE-like protein
MSKATANDERGRKEHRISPSEMISLAVFGLSVFTLTGLLFYNPVEYFAREATRHPREVPFLFARILYSNVGIASYLVVVFAAIWSAVQFFRERVRAIGLKAFGIVLLGCSCATLAGTIAASGGDGARLRSGGIVGTFLSERLQELVGPIGLYAVLLVFLAVSLIFVTDWFFVALFRRMSPALAGFGGLGAHLIAPLRDEERDEPKPRSAEPSFRRPEPARETIEPPAAESHVRILGPAPREAEPIGEDDEPTFDRRPAAPLEESPVELPPPTEPAESEDELPPRARFVEPPALEPLAEPCPSVDGPAHRFEIAETEPAAERDAEREMDVEREIEIDPEQLVLDDEDDETSEDIIILDASPDDAKWLEMEESESTDDSRSVAEILGEIAEPVAGSADDDAAGGLAIDVEIEHAEPELPAVAATLPAAPASVEAPAPVAAAEAEIEEPRPVVRELPADAERVEALTRELASERRRAESAAPSSTESDSGGPREEALYKDAVRTVIEARRGSVSLLQRRLALGYARATKFLERMEREGIVGPYEGAKARDVLVTLEEWDALSE